MHLALPRSKHLQAAILSRKAVPNTYLDACKLLGIVPASVVCNRAGEADLSLRYYGLGPKGAEALAKALRVGVGLAVVLACR